jgi:hypothetical protein
LIFFHSNLIKKQPHGLPFLHEIILNHSTVSKTAEIVAVSFT